MNHPVRGKDPGQIPSGLLPNGEKLLVPELTEVTIVLRDDMKSGFTRPGSEVVFLTKDDVYGPGPKLVLTKGTPVVGHVVASGGYKPFGQSGHLFLTADYILAQDKTRIPLRSVEKQARGRGNTAAALGAGLLAAGVGGAAMSSLNLEYDIRSRWWPTGMILGPIVAALLPGKNVNLHPGQEFVVQTEQDVAVSAPLPTVLDTSRVLTEEDERKAVLIGSLNYPRIVTRSGTFYGLLKKDSDSDWATVYGYLGQQDRVRLSDIITISKP